MSMGVKPPEKMAGRVQPCVDDCNGFLGGSEAGLAGSAGTKKSVAFLAPQHCQPHRVAVPASPTLRTHPSHHHGQTAPIAGPSHAMWDRVAWIGGAGAITPTLSGFR